MANSLVDPFGRAIEYVRLSVTDRCDLRCVYCLPKGYKDFAEPDTWLDFDEIERVISVFGRLGVNRIRITGGEPLVRHNISHLVNRLSALEGISDLSLSTNAVQLNKQAAALKDAGIQRINVSLDTLKPERFKAITSGHLDKVLNGLQVARRAGFSPIKINMVVMKDINDDEIEDMIEFCIAEGHTLRFIETMPVGNTGSKATDRYYSLAKAKERLEQKYTLLPSSLSGGGPARYYQIGGTDLRVGFITPMSQHFCETCNRVRLSADGMLYLCLGQNDMVDLRTPLRSGIDNDGLEQLIMAAIARKPERHEFNTQPGHVVRFMSQTGG
ncbi:MAG: GTP 3',8-cyclase MoaA [Gammaproteobacteria bacterium]|nr:GTP 3',8-cyclase MoaA [Gammaproteobacteria bacterium]MDH5592888.1 GTP 3',8-cyclase MoaA [Gammaproteobacteria bacterium]MDH5614388.1 GTP 3',8-cyclase MoaA [Gammaproteobacteria bacterium]